MPKARILVVEDQRIVARDIELCLRGLGYATPATAADGEEAVRLAGELRPDLVLMDVHLGGDIDGVEAAAVIRQRFDIPVVFLTAHADEATVGRATAAEGFGYVIKPFDERDLAVTIDLALHKHELESRLRASEAALRQARDELETRVRERTAELARANADLRDEIAERRRAEDALQQAQDDLEQRVAERTAQLTRSNAELDQFAYVASHDLREPLRTIYNNIQRLERGYQDRLDEHAERHIGRAIECARLLDQLIEHLYTHSRIGREGEPAAVHVVDVLAEVCANLRALLDEHEAAVSSGPLPDVWGLRRDLVLLFQNLIQNAVKFRGPQPPEISISGERLDDEWLFRVRDNGLGIAPDYHAKIFEIGTQSRLHGRKIPGTGFGLANCRKIVERHGGRIRVESALGAGSTFCFTLPAVP